MRYVLAAALALWAFPVHAQVSATVTLSADRTSVVTGQPFRLVARADVRGANVERFDMPELAGFEVRSRQVSRPMQIQLGFGQQQQVVTSSTVHTLILVPTQPGTVQVSPVTVVAGGQTFRSSPLTLTVTGPGTPGTPQQLPQNPQNPLANPQAASGEGYQFDSSAFLRTVVSDDAPYVGQQIEVSLFLYSASRVRVPTVTREPAADGFWMQDLMGMNRRLEERRQTVGGQRFFVYELRKFAAFPLRPGELQIGAAAADIVLGASLGDIFNGGGGRQQLTREGVDLTIEVRPLPDPVPANVLVGNATLDVRADRSQVRTGDAVALTATLRGTGNLRDVRFTLPEVEGVRVLEPTIDDTVVTPGDQVGGQRRFEWLIVPEQPGRHVLPTLRFHTFNVADGTYQEVRGPEVVIVAAGNAIATAETPETEEAETAELDPAELRFESIRSTSEMHRSRSSLAGSPLFWGLFAAPPVLFLLLLGVGLARRRTPDERKVGEKRLKARLQDARAKSTEGDSRGFYGSIAKTITDALEMRLGEKIGSFTQAELHDALIRRGLTSEDARAITSELETCDFARFSSAGSSADEMAGCLSRTDGILKSIDRLEKEAA